MNLATRAACGWSLTGTRGLITKRGFKPEVWHVPIADRNGRGKGGLYDAAQAERYKIRSCAEQANSRLKEDFGACNVMVKGHCKVRLYLMRGVVVLFADQLLRLAG